VSSYNPSAPALLLLGQVGSISGKDLYGVDNGTGLQNTYLTYNIEITGISSQSIGDESVRTGSGRQYNGIDVKVGDFIAQITGGGEGTKILRVSEISSKAASSVTCVVEDIDMFVARTSSTRDNSLDDSSYVIIFEVDPDGRPILYGPLPSDFSGVLIEPKVYPSIISYFNTYTPLFKRRFYQDPAPNLSLSDVVTVNSSGEWVKVSSPDELVAGEVAAISTDPRTFYIRPINKIIDDFEYPPGLTAGSPGSVWYTDTGVSGGYSLTESGGSKKLYLQLSNPVPTTVTGTTGFTLSSGDSIILNGIVAATGGATGASQSSVISQINTSTSQHHVEASTFSSSASTESGDGTLRFS